jgi:hypothetical protein
MADTIIATFNLTYPELITTANAIHTFMLRDTTEFAGFGILALDITAFKTKIDTFGALPTDDELLAVLKSSTANKETLSNELRIMLRGIDQRAYLAFSSDEGKYGLFHTGSLSKLTDSELLVFGRQVKRSCDLYHTELLVYGLTALMITALNTLNNDFETSMDTQQTAISARDAATNNRAKKAMELYELMMKYCDVGKTIWYETNEAYYNDYVIFGTSSSGLPSKVQNFNFNYETNMFTWTAISSATSYEIEFSPNNIDWTNKYTGTAAEAYYCSQEGTWFFRCRATNDAGPGSWSDTFIMNALLSTPNLYSIEVIALSHRVTILWGEASSHSPTYEVWRSIVPISEPAGTFTKVTDTPDTNYYHEPASINTREYYYVIAKTTGARSGKSATLYTDINP